MFMILDLLLAGTFLIVPIILTIWAICERSKEKREEDIKHRDYKDY